MVPTCLHNIKTQSFDQDDKLINETIISGKYLAFEFNKLIIFENIDLIFPFFNGNPSNLKKAK